VSIRNCFVPPDGHVILEFDYSQLEVRVLAALSRDVQLIDDLNTGIDIHCRSLSFLSGQPYSVVKDYVDRGDPVWIAKRKKAKAVSFLFQYGGGVKSAAAKTGLHESDVRRYIDNYNKIYSDTKRYSDAVLKEVQFTRQSTNQYDRGIPVGVGYYTAPTGRVYGFKEVFSEYTGKPQFSMPQIKNYPVQGTGWDIVGLMMTAVDDMIKDNNHPAWLFNTVHDSLMYYVHEDHIADFYCDAKVVLQSVRSQALKAWGWNMPDIPFTVDAKVGVTWEKLEEI
jgi:DNA polymerase I